MSFVHQIGVSFPEKIEHFMTKTEYLMTCSQCRKLFTECHTPLGTDHLHHLTSSTSKTPTSKNLNTNPSSKNLRSKTIIGRTGSRIRCPRPTSSDTLSPVQHRNQRTQDTRIQDIGDGGSNVATLVNVVPHECKIQYCKRKAY